MEEVIHYLELKNQYYEKFCSVTARFLEQAANDKWDELEFFVDNRERILNIIRSYDFRIARAFESADVSQTNLDSFRPQVKALMDKRAALASRIVALDLELIARLDDVKSETIRELKKTLETSQQLGSFEAPAPGPTPRKTA